MVWLLAILAYLLGSLSFAVLLSRWFGTQDPRASGSGNPGATNMLRVAGKKLAILTLLGDVGKGLLPVLVARWLGLGVMEEAWVGIAAVIGHLYPLYFNFRGGKGVATAAGMLLGLYPPAVLLAAAAWLLTFKLSRTSSLASLVATPLTLPFAGLAAARSAAADDRADRPDRLAAPRQLTRSVRRPRTAFLIHKRKKLHAVWPSCVIDTCLTATWRPLRPPAATPSASAAGR